MYGTIARIEWTDVQVATLKNLWAKGLSAGQITGELPFSRNAIISKVYRLKLPPRANGHASPRKSIATPPTETQSGRPFLSPAPAPRLRNGHDPSQRRNPSHNILAKLAIAEAEPGLPEDLKGDVPDGTGIKLIELTDATCHWPRGNPTDPDFEFCGGKALPSLPYCARHSRIAYTSATDRRRQQPRF